MDNKKLMETMGKYAVHKYVEKLINTKMHKITLFASFAKTGAINLSDSRELLVLEDLRDFTALNCGEDKN